MDKFKSLSGGIPSGLVCGYSCTVNIHTSHKRDGSPFPKMPTTPIFRTELRPQIGIRVSLDVCE